MNIQQIQNIKNGDRVNIATGEEFREKLIVVRTDLADFCEVNFLYSDNFNGNANTVSENGDIDFIKLTIEELLNDYFVLLNEKVSSKL